MLKSILLAAAMFPLSLTAQEMVLKPAEYHGMPGPKIAHELYVFGLSYHTNRDYDYNEQNPGLGYGIELYDPRPNKFISASWFAAMGTYKDSYSEQAYFIGVGPRLTFGQRDDFHTTFSLLVSYLDGSGKQGPVAIPILSLDYKYVGIGITGDPTAETSGNTDEPGSNMIAVFLKFTLVNF